MAGSCVYFGLTVNVTRSPVSYKNSLAFCVGTDSFMFPKYELQYGAYDDERHRILSAWSVCLLLNLHIHSIHRKR